MTATTNDNDIELLSRYVDGELPAAESRALEARLHGEPELRSTLVRFEELNHRLTDMMAEKDQIPASINALFEQAPFDQARLEQARLEQEGTAVTPPVQNKGENVVAFPGAAPSIAVERSPRWAYAMAASVAAAVGLSLIVNTDTGNSLPGNDSVVSAALDGQASGAPWISLEDGRELRAVLTFPHEDGRWCREYLLRGGASDWRAVACRDADRWVTQAAGLESFMDSADAYRAAGSEDAEPVAVFISQHAADIALGAADERQLMDSDWR